MTQGSGLGYPGSLHIGTLHFLCALLYLGLLFILRNNTPVIPRGPCGITVYTLSGRLSVWSGNKPSRAQGGLFMALVESASQETGLCCQPGQPRPLTLQGSSSLDAAQPVTSKVALVSVATAQRSVWQIRAR